MAAVNIKECGWFSLGLRFGQGNGLPHLQRTSPRKDIVPVLCIYVSMNKWMHINNYFLHLFLCFCCLFNHIALFAFLVAYWCLSRYRTFKKKTKNGKQLLHLQHLTILHLKMCGVFLFRPAQAHFLTVLFLHFGQATATDLRVGVGVVKAFKHTHSWAEKVGCMRTWKKGNPISAKCARSLARLC